MTNFCSKCGEKIEDCKCLTEKSKKIVFDFPKAINNIISIIKKPDIKMANMIKEDNNYIYSIFYMILSSILKGFLAIVLIFKMTNLYFNFINYNNIFLINISYMQIFIGIVIISLISLLIFSFSIYLIINKLFKHKIDYNIILKTIAFNSSFEIVAILITLLLSIIYMPLLILLLILIFGKIMFLINTYFNIEKFLKINRYQLFYEFFMSAIVSIIVIYIVSNFFII